MIGCNTALHSSPIPFIISHWPVIPTCTTPHMLTPWHVSVPLILLPPCPHLLPCMLTQCCWYSCGSYSCYLIGPLHPFIWASRLCSVAVLVMMAACTPYSLALRLWMGWERAWYLPNGSKCRSNASHVENSTRLTSSTNTVILLCI